MNDAPVSEDISSTTDEDTEKEITLKATDVEGSDLTYSIVSEPSNGTVTISGSTATLYSDNYNGSDSFTYKANDGTDDSNTATVSITVTAVNDTPVSEDISITTLEIDKEITLKATDVEGSDLTYSIVSEPSNGTVTISGSTATYTPSDNYNGSDSFTQYTTGQMIVTLLQ